VSEFEGMRRWTLHWEAVVSADEVVEATTREGAVEIFHRDITRRLLDAGFDAIGLEISKPERPE